MSRYLSDVARTEFDSEVKHAYQTEGSGLRNVVSLRTGVVGDTHKFRKMGKGAANQRSGPSSDVTPMNVTHSLQTATLTNWEAPEYTDIFDAAEVNFDEQKELAMTISGAMRRREDQLVIDALDTASAGGTVGTDIGGTGSDWNADKARRAARLLDDKGVPATDRNILYSAFGKEALLADTEVTSSDFNSVKALVNGEIDTWLGFKWHTIETRDEGGLPKTTNTRTSFAFHKMAIGLAVGIDIQTRVDWVAHKRSWLAIGILKAGSVARDTDGIIDITTTEAS